VSSECGAVVSPVAFAVALHARQVQQHREPSRALDEGPDRRDLEALIERPSRAPDRRWLRSLWSGVERPAKRLEQLRRRGRKIVCFHWIARQVVQLGLA
jgi:hypothetical protein